MYYKLANQHTSKLTNSTVNQCNHHTTKHKAFLTYVLAGCIANKVSDFLVGKLVTIFLLMKADQYIHVMLIS